jgi:hypothetical protein
LGHALVRQFGARVPQSWNDIDAQIKASNVPAEEQEKAKAIVWNSMTPQQQDAVKTGAVKQAGGAAAPATRVPAVFDPAAWAAANPGKDVNVAIAAAKQRGFQIKQ